MSELKRYDHFIKAYTKSFVDVTGARYVYPDAGMTESVEGKYVEYADYARLKAEVDAIREAGNALAAWTLTLEHTYNHEPMDGLPFSSFLCVWHDTAKEGKPSE